jgi:hypothetical protein
VRRTAADSAAAPCRTATTTADRARGTRPPGSACWQRSLAVHLTYRPCDVRTGLQLERQLLQPQPEPELAAPAQPGRLTEESQPTRQERQARMAARFSQLRVDMVDVSPSVGDSVPTVRSQACDELSVEGAAIAAVTD